jgi:hypothetical protein
LESKLCPLESLKAVSLGVVLGVLGVEAVWVAIVGSVHRLESRAAEAVGEQAKSSPFGKRGLRALGP